MSCVIETLVGGELNYLFWSIGIVDILIKIEMGLLAQIREKCKLDLE